MATTLDNHSGLQFTSGAVDYIGLNALEHEDGVGTIWSAIPKNHDLDTGPVTPVIVLAPDVVTPVRRFRPITRMCGQILLFAGNIEPDFWAFCDGRLMLISANRGLYEIIGTRYGGNGITTFGIPDLRGRIPIGHGAGPGLTTRALGEEGGTESVILDESQIPAHEHELQAQDLPATQDQPAGNVIAQTSARDAFRRDLTGPAILDSGSIGTTGSGAPHANIQPCLVLQYIICIGDEEAEPFEEV